MLKVSQYKHGDFSWCNCILKAFSHVCTEIVSLNEVSNGFVNVFVILCAMLIFVDLFFPKNT